MEYEELQSLLLGVLSAAVIVILTCYFFRRHHVKKSTVQCTCICNNNYSSGPVRSNYFLGATALFSRPKELPISIQSLLCTTTYRSVLELEIIEEKDPDTGLRVGRFYTKDKDSSSSMPNKIQ